MDLKLAKTLQGLMEDTGEYAEIFYDYSGRCMYGKSTTGLIVKHIELLIAVIIESPDRFVDDDSDPVFPDVGKIRFDNVGAEKIVY